jgi:hypothetical protein
MVSFHINKTNNFCSQKIDLFIKFEIVEFSMINYGMHLYKI